jgi:hypothetical protein
VVLSAIIGGSFALQFSTGSFASVDGYFHARFAALLWQAGVAGFPPAFPWLPLTIRSADRYADHHLLFHVLLGPAAAFDVVWGAKIASAAFAAAALAVVYAILRRNGVQRAEWWLLALIALAPDFLSRTQMPRVQALSLIVLLVALELSLARRFVWLLPLALVFTWLYDAFLFLLSIVGLSAVAVAIRERRFAWRVVAFPLAGVVIGLIVNPYFPHNVTFIAQHYLGKVDLSATMRVGTEWYPYPAAEWLGWGGALAVLLTTVIVAGRARADLTTDRLARLLVAMLFFTLTWRSRRFIEYAAPFVTIALAASLHRWAEVRIQALAARWRRGLAAALLLGCAVSVGFSVRQLRRKPPPGQYAACAAWLQQHTAAGTIVFNASWDAFPLLFFHNQHNRYVIGLDPAYLAQRDPALYEAWLGLTRGELTPPSRHLARFGTGVVLVEPTYAEFVQVLQSDRSMEPAFAGGDCLIFRRRDTSQP